MHAAQCNSLQYSPCHRPPSLPPPPPLQSASSAPSAECVDVSQVVGKLQAGLGQRLWPREQPSLAHPLVPSAAAVALFVQSGE